MILITHHVRRPSRRFRPRLRIELARRVDELSLASDQFDRFGGRERRRHPEVEVRRPIGCEAEAIPVGDRREHESEFESGEAVADTGTRAAPEREIGVLVTRNVLSFPPFRAERLGIVLPALVAMH